MASLAVITGGSAAAKGGTASLGAISTALVVCTNANTAPGSTFSPFDC